MAQFATSITFPPTKPELLETVVAVLGQHEKEDYYAYERNGTWHVALGSKVSFFIDAKGETSTIEKDGKSETAPVHGALADETRKFLKAYSPKDGKVFGNIAFNYAAHSRGQAYTPGRWPLVALMVPHVEITLSSEYCTVSGYSDEQARAICAMIKTAVCAEPGAALSLNIMYGADEYVTRVENALKEIGAGMYDKVIPSRYVRLQGRIDMIGTLLNGRRNNTPKRSYTLSHKGRQATGFSPELVALIEGKKVITEPLAGTRSREGSEEVVESLRQVLLHDTKEIAEHVMSVKEAVWELEQFCAPGTTVVEDLMSIRPRGPVQHLGSRVGGYLADDKDAWDAFDVLFPSITAAGIPKPASLEAIQRLEVERRELYSGAIMLIDGDKFLEATLVLRTCFQDTERAWLQAGAGVIAQSKPQRELTETVEKLGSVAPFVVAAKTA